MDIDGITIEDIPKVLPLLSQHEQERILAELEKLEVLKTRDKAQNEFMAFVKEVWPDFIGGRHYGGCV